MQAVMSDQETQPVVLGRINGVFGVSGWVKVFDYSRDRGGILDYPRWLLDRGGGWKEVSLLAGQRHGKGVIAHLQNCDDRDQAMALVGAEIGVWPAWLTPPAEGEYFWYQLEGLAVINLEGDSLGQVDHLLETGANDVLVARSDRERLIPYVPQTVHKVDLEKGQILVDWDKDF